MLSGEVKLGGKTFQVVNYDVITALNEHYIMKLMRATGLDKVLPLVEGETNDQYMMRLQAALVDTLRLAELLGGFLLPLGRTETDWSLQMAAETQRFIEGLTRPDDKATLHSLGFDVTMDFFRAGIDSLKHSQSVLANLREIPAQRSPSQDSPNQSAAH